MTVHGLRMQVAGGQGLVVAGPVGALFVDDDGNDPGRVAAIEALVRAVTAVPDGAGEPGAMLVRRVRDLADDALAFGLVAEIEDGVAVLVSGGVAVQHTAADGTRQTVSADDSARPTERVLPGPAAGMTVSTDAGAAVQTHPLADLGLGAVGGGGFALVPREPRNAAVNRDAYAVPDEAPRPEPQPQWTPQWEPVVAEPQPEPQPESQREPQWAPHWEPVAAETPVESSPPVWTPASAPAPESPWSQPEPPAVQPESPWSQPEPPAPQPEPAAEPETVPSGPPVLHRPDGSTLEVGRLVVLGREPQISPLVASGDAEPVTLDDEARVTSRVHASIVADGDALTITDLGSANGTWILQQGDSEWTELTANEPTALQVGGRIRIGSEEFVLGPPSD